MVVTESIELIYIGIDFGGSPGMCPCIYHFLPPSAPPTIFWFAHPIFLTTLRQCYFLYIWLKFSCFNLQNGVEIVISQVRSIVSKVALKPRDKLFDCQ